ncbi:hypothetical protein AB8S09_15510 [Clostridium sp. MT-113]|uniref:Uncharacterized protein n=1 Tax=Clostridium lapidicellarium TaxID=3240931 RepID=A0ABV4E1M3_9CLOT
MKNIRQKIILDIIILSVIICGGFGLFKRDLKIFHTAVPDLLTKDTAGRTLENITLQKI